MVGAQPFHLDAPTAGVTFDALVTAKRAYYAGRDKGPGVEVPLALTWSRRATRAFAADIDKKVSVRPRKASVRITLRRMIIRRGKDGRTIKEISLARRLDATIGDLARRRALRARFRPDLPTTTIAGLRRKYETVLTVDRTNLKLRPFKRLRWAKI